MWKSRLISAGFEDSRREPQTKECRIAPESGKGQETDFPQEDYSFADTLIWVQRDLCQISEPTEL